MAFLVIFGVPVFMMIVLPFSIWHFRHWRKEGEKNERIAAKVKSWRMISYKPVDFYNSSFWTGRD